MRTISTLNTLENAAWVKFREGRKPKPINEMTELIPGMLINKIGSEHDAYRVVFADPFRDNTALCLDDCGHTELVPAWDGDYEILPDGHAKLRIAYGPTPDGKVKISKDYYYSEQDFKEKNPQAHFWYVEALHGTIKIVEDKKL